MLADSDVVRGIKQINQITKSMLWMENHESESDNSNSTSDASCNLLDPCCYTIFIIRPRSYMHTQRQPHARTFLYTDWHTVDTHARTFPRNMSCLYSHVIPSWIIGTCTMSRPIVARDWAPSQTLSCTCCMAHRSLCVANGTSLASPLISTIVYVEISVLPPWAKGAGINNNSLV